MERFEDLHGLHSTPSPSLHGVYAISQGDNPEYQGYDAANDDDSG